MATVIFVLTVTGGDLWAVWQVLGGRVFEWVEGVAPFLETVSQIAVVVVIGDRWATCSTNVNIGTSSHSDCDGLLDINGGQLVD